MKTVKKTGLTTEPWGTPRESYSTSQALKLENCNVN